MNFTQYKMFVSKMLLTIFISGCSFLLFPSLALSANAAEPSVARDAVSSESTSGVPKLKPISVQLTWHHQFQFAGFYAALQQGYYRDAGLDVTLNSWQPGISVLDEVLAERADYAIGHSSIIVDYAKGAPIKLVMASFEFSPMVLLSHEPINDLEQLSGQTVMHSGNLQIKALINKASGLVKQPIQEIYTSGNLQDFVDKKVDFYAAYFTNEPYRLKQSNTPFFTLDPKSYGVQSYGGLIFTSQKKAELSPAEIERFRAATIAGWEYAIHHQVETVDFILQNFKVEKARDALLAEAEATTKYVKSGSRSIGEIQGAKLLATAADAKDSGLMSDLDYSSFSVEDFIFNSSRSDYSTEELIYLKNNPTLTIGNDINWPPFEFVDEQGRYAGMAAEYMGWVAKELNLKITPVKDKLWSQVMSDIKAGHLDMLPAAVATEQRLTFLNFTEPYLSFPMVIVAKDNIDFVADLNQLSGKRIAVVKGYATEDLLRMKYPQANIIQVDGVENGLQSVLQEKADYYLENLAAVNFVIKKRGITGLKVVGSADERFELGMGVPKNNPLLLSILQKTLDRMPEAEKNRIYNHWLQLEVVTKSYRWLYIIAILLFVLLLIATVWVVAVHSSKIILQSYIDTVNELSLATVVNNEGIITWVSHKFTELSGYDEEELIGQPASITKSSTMPDEEYRALYKRVLMGETWQGEVEGRRKDGSAYYVNLTAIPELRFGKVQKVTITREDLTDRKKAEELSIRDALTGLYNRRYFSEVFEREIKRAKREGVPFVFAIADIDFFKQLNDTYGHQQGDIALQKVSSLLLQSLRRPQDLLFRLGGEEFGMILNELDLEHVSQFLNSLNVAIHELGIQNRKGIDGVLTLSCGALFISPDHQLNGDTIFKLADDLMYQAKEAGRNQVVVEAFK